MKVNEFTTKLIELIEEFNEDQKCIIKDIDLQFTSNTGLKQYVVYTGVDIKIEFPNL